MPAIFASKHQVMKSNFLTNKKPMIIFGPTIPANLNNTLGAAIEHTSYKTDKLFINSVYYRNSRVMKTSLDKEVVLGERRG